MEQEPIVVVGAGFGGLRAAHELDRGLRRAKLTALYRVVLVDQNRYHTYTPLLTETATALEASARERKRSVTIDITETLGGTGIEFIHDRVTDLDAGKRLVAFLNHPPLTYTAIIVALGGETNYFDIPGLREHSFALKTLADAQELALLLKTRIAAGDLANIVVGGGGPTGIELAGGLAALNQELRRRFPQHPFTVTVVEAQPSILPGFASPIIARARKMLAAQGVRFQTGARIVRVDEKNIALENGTAASQPYDLFIWTGGVKASALLDQLSIQLEHGRAAVDPSMTCLSSTPDLSFEGSLYAIGDIVCFHDPNTGASVPWVARAALDQAVVAAQNLLERLKAQHMPGYLPRIRAYVPHVYPYIIPIGRRDAIAHVWGMTLTGKPARFIKWLVELRYVLHLLPFRHAVRMWWGGRKMTV